MKGMIMNSAVKVTNGLVVGKFAMLTLGHINLIHAAAMDCEQLKVLLCFDEKFLAKQKPRDQQRLTLKNRLRWLKETYQDMPHITIDYIDETNIPAYPNGWQHYAQLIRDSYGGTIPNDTAVFSSELEYDDDYKKYLPELQHLLVDPARTQVPISATKIRNNLYQHWDMVPSVVRKDYTLKVCFIGTESCGKTTLVKSLAKLYNTSWALEYGRTYCETVVFGDETLLESSDYSKIAFQHKCDEEHALRTANKLCFIDSCAITTEFFHRLNLGTTSEVVSAIARHEEYDLILYLTDDVPWVNDGTRVNGDKRQETRALFETVLAEYPNHQKKVQVISGSTYRERADNAKAAVEALLERFDIGHNS
jgi:HTH-type transcriptional repressor of NAD biosynthesis genes